MDGFIKLKGFIGWLNKSFIKKLKKKYDMFMNNFFLLKKSCKLHTYLKLYAFGRKL